MIAMFAPSTTPASQRGPILGVVGVLRTPRCRTLRQVRVAVGATEGLRQVPGLWLRWRRLPALLCRLPLPALLCRLAWQPGQMPDRERLRHLAVDRHHRVRPDPGRWTCLPGAPHDRGDQQGCRRGPGHRVDRQLGSPRVHDQVPAGVEEEAGEPAAEDPAESARPTQSATEHRHPDAVAHQPGEDHVHERPEDSTHDPDVEHPGHIRGRVDDSEHRGVHDILEDLETESHEHAGDQSVPGAVPPRPADLQQQPDAHAFRQFLGVCPAEDMEISDASRGPVP